MTIHSHNEALYSSVMDEKQYSKLKTVLEEKGIKPVELARLLKTDSQTITNWCRRGVPSARLIETANALRVPVDQLAENKKVVQGAVTLQWETEAESARDFVNQNRSTLSNLSVDELNKLAGYIDSIIDMKKNQG